MRSSTSAAAIVLLGLVAGCQADTWATIRPGDVVLGTPPKLAGIALGHGCNTEEFSIRASDVEPPPFVDLVNFQRINELRTEDTGFDVWIFWHPDDEHGGWPLDLVIITPTRGGALEALLAEAHVEVLDPLAELGELDRSIPGGVGRPYHESTWRLPPGGWRFSPTATVRRTSLPGVFIFDGVSPKVLVLAVDEAGLRRNVKLFDAGAVHRLEAELAKARAEGMAIERLLPIGESIRRLPPAPAAYYEAVRERAEVAKLRGQFESLLAERIGEKLAQARAEGWPVERIRPLLEPARALRDGEPSKRVGDEIARLIAERVEERAAGVRRVTVEGIARARAEGCSLESASGLCDALKGIEPSPETERVQGELAKLIAERSADWARDCETLSPGPFAARMKALDGRVVQAVAGVYVERRRRAGLAYAAAGTSVLLWRHDLPRPVDLLRETPAAYPRLSLHRDVDSPSLHGDLGVSVSRFSSPTTGELIVDVTESDDVAERIEDLGTEPVRRRVYDLSPALQARLRAAQKAMKENEHYRGQQGVVTYYDDRAVYQDPDGRTRTEYGDFSVKRRGLDPYGDRPSTETYTMDNPYLKDLYDKAASQQLAVLREMGFPMEGQLTEPAKKIVGQLLAGKEVPPDAGMVEVGRVAVRKQTFTGRLVWTLSVTGVRTERIEVAAAGADAGAFRDGAAGNTTVSKEAALKTLREKVQPAARSRVVGLVDEVFAKRAQAAEAALERHVAKIADPARRAEEGAWGRFWLGLPSAAGDERFTK